MLKYFKLYLALVIILCLTVSPLSVQAEENPAKQLALGMMYLSGDGVDKNLDKAIELIAKSALQGNDQAQFTLGLIYSDPMFTSPPAEEKSQFWFKKSAAQGNQKAIEALSMLEASFANMLPFEELLKQAELGDANAQYLLRARYLHGTGNVEKDPVQARKWLIISAEQGDALAQSDLGLILIQEQSYDDGIKFMTLAAEQGVVNAQYELSGLYYKGQIVPKDMKKVVYWLEKAAAQGDKRAISSLKVIN